MSQEAAGTLGWLVARYRETDPWQRLSLATRRRRENILKQTLISAGDKPIRRITNDVIAAGREMNAIFGWTGSCMALRYIEAADRKRLAQCRSELQT
jgi:hypothetical protein